MLTHHFKFEIIKMMFNNSLFTKLATWGIFILALLFFINFFNLSYPISVVTSQRSSELSVVGEGKVDVVPDTAYVNVGISVSNESTVSEVQNKINEVNNKIIDALSTLNIDKKDIKTSNYSINPNQTFENGVTKINGYNGNASVSIKLTDINKVAQVIEQATNAGANQVQGARFSVDNPDKYREEARNMAIENAKTQANGLAQKLGIRLGKVTNIVESSQNGGPVPMAMKAMDSAVAGGPAIEPGSETITSVVTLYFEKR